MQVQVKVVQMQVQVVKVVQVVQMQVQVVQVVQVQRYKRCRCKYRCRFYYLSCESAHPAQVHGLGECGEREAGG